MFNAAIWRLDLKQEFVYVGDEGIVEPGGKTKREGIDLSIRYQIMSWLFVDQDINLTKPRIKNISDGNNYIPLAPIFSSVGGVALRFKNGFTGSLRYRYLGDRPANENYSATAKGYMLGDAVINYSRKNFEVKLSAENIFNSKWKEAQFETTSKLPGETESHTEIHFTPGTPLFVKIGVMILF